MTTTEETAVTVAAPPKVGSIAMDEGGIQLRSFDDAYRFAQAVVKSKDFCPNGLDTAEKVMLAIQTGMELGFSVMRSLGAVFVVNGRPGLYGEAVMALIHNKGVCSRPPILTCDGEGDARRGICRFQRKDMPEPVETVFTVADAKRAGLWGKRTWVPYPDDMLQWRALARATKRYFSDVTMGLPMAEELEDYPAVAALRSETPPPGPDPLLAEVDEAEPFEAVQNAREGLIAAIMIAGTAVFKTNRAAADIEISAATGGKVQTIDELEKNGQPDQLAAVLAHFEALRGC